MLTCVLNLEPSLENIRAPYTAAWRELEYQYGTRALAHGCTWTSIWRTLTLGYLYCTRIHSNINMAHHWHIWHTSTPIWHTRTGTQMHLNINMAQCWQASTLHRIVHLNINLARWHVWHTGALEYQYGTWALAHRCTWISIWHACTLEYQYGTLALAHGCTWTSIWHTCTLEYQYGTQTLVHQCTWTSISNMAHYTGVSIRHTSTAAPMHLNINMAHFYTRVFILYTNINMAHHWHIWHTSTLVQTGGTLSQCRLANNIAHNCYTSG